MRFTSNNRSGLLALGAMFIIAAFGFLASRAGDTLTTATTTAAANPPLNVREANVDASGNIKVHEQGTVSVTGTVNVGNGPSVQDVRVTNSPLFVKGDVNAGQGTVKETEVIFLHQDTDIEFDIHEFDKVRLSVLVNGSGTVDFFWATDAGLTGDFSVDAGHRHSVYLGDLPGTRLTVYLTDPDGEQVFLYLFGSN